LWPEIFPKSILDFEKRLAVLFFPEDYEEYRDKKQGCNPFFSFIVCREEGG
jgi:hypothetical protein